MNCPSCGDSISYDERFAVLISCPSCKSAIVFDEKVARIAGTMSAIALPAGPLFLSAEGRIQGDYPFEVLGRVRYGYANGFWDEWYLKHNDGNATWITEDEKRFMHEQSISLDIDSAALKGLRPGQSLELNDKTFVIQESDTAICEGGEGQLPFAIVTGEEIHYLDLLAEDGQTATLEIEPDGSVKFYQGRALQYSDIQVANEFQRPQGDQLAAGRQGGDGQRERVTYDSNRQVSIKCGFCGGSNEKIDLSQESINCEYCDESLDVPAKGHDCPGCGASVGSFSDDAMAINCAYCGSTFSITGSEPTLLMQLREQDKERQENVDLLFKLGSKCHFDSYDYTVVGYVRYREYYHGLHITNDYLLYNKEWGYRWLSEYNGHFTLEEKFEGAIPHDPSEMAHYSYRRIVHALDDNWQFYDSGDQSIQWVEGELPWVAQRDDSYNYVELIKPPYMLNCEYTEQEVEWHLSRYVEHEEIAEAFQMDIKGMPRMRGIAGAQVNKNSGYWWSSALVCFCFALLGLLFSCRTGGSDVTKIHISPQQYENEFLTEPFEIKSGGICKIFFHAPVDNSWVYMNAALVNEKDEAIADFSGNMSYYHGYDDGNWTEGSQDDSLYLKLEKGKYRLLLLGQAGKGEREQGIQHGKKVTIRIKEGVMVRYYFVIFAVLAIILMLYFIVRIAIFQTRKWQHAQDDD